MESIGFTGDQAIRNGMFAKTVETAQKRVEGNNFDIRKTLLEYDDVLRQQRETIYRKRRNALFGDRLAIDLSEMFYDVCVALVEDYWQDKDYEGFAQAMITTFGCESPFDENEFLQERPHRLYERHYPIVYENYKQKIQKLGERAYPVIERVYLSEGHRFQNIAIPITDGKKTLNVVAPLKKCYETKGREIGLSIEKGITLAVIDNAWKEHLREMDDLKQSVQNASYEQKDPL